MMRTTTKFTFIAMGICLFSLNIGAQNKVVIEDDEDPKTVIITSKKNAGKEVVRILDETKSPKFNEHNTPRFLLTSREKNFALGIGGYVRGLVAYDFDGIVNGIDFCPANMPAPGTTGVKNQFQMSVSHTTLFLKMVGKTKKLGDVVVYVNGNFCGDNTTLKLHNAYIQFLGLLAGFNFGNFMDLAAVAPTIDYKGPVGMVNYRIVQLSYAYNKLKHWSFAVAAEMPTVSETLGTYDAANSTKEAAQRMPNFTGNVQYSWTEGSHLRAAAIVRSMTYNSITNDDIKAKSTFGWGLQLSGVIGLSQRLKIFGQGTAGKGIGHFINDIGNLDVDLVPDPEQHNKMQALPTLGWYAGTRFDFNPNVYMSATYSQSRIWREDGWPAPNSDFYKRGQYLVANVFWHITPYLLTGAEYLRGWKSTFAESTQHANRINLMLQYSF